MRNYRSDPAQGTRFTVLDKASGKVVSVATGPACFGFPHVDAHESDGCLCVDLPAYPGAAIVERLRLDRLRSEEPLDAVARLTRFRLPLREPAGRATAEVMCEVPIELPRTDERRRRAALPAGVVWGNDLTRHGHFIDDVTRIDLRTVPPTVRRWHRPGHYLGEPVFVPRPGGEAADDGVLLSVVLDAATLIETARATLPHAMPFGFHGEHVKEKDR